MKNSKAIHALFIVGVAAAGLLAGFLNMPGEWYASLAKPPFNPPDWLFGPVWTVLYVFIGWAGARSFLSRRAHPATFGLWVVQLVLNLAWMPVFFGLHMMVPALIIILVLLLAILAFIARTRQHDRLSAGLFVPYALWVAFATLLNAALIYLN
ncbi:TspO/MBR family protein [Martelella soudanensis]|uniref:TspO/MBR family protein n=1 Tax=unclassified Martelella TaxID=2629616 RepID=UPI0015DDF6B3|nr:MULTISPECIES: TspO/MBR family protein [unclassified Martelella]